MLQTLAEQGHELPNRILEWRQLAKLKSTYADSLVTDINPATGRVHTSFAMAVASTGRLSSNDPNLQNIPIRTEEGSRIRHAFIAEPGHVLVSADYSQSAGLLAHVADLPCCESGLPAAGTSTRTASGVLGCHGGHGPDDPAARAITSYHLRISAFGLARRQDHAGSGISVVTERYQIRTIWNERERGPDQGT